VADRRLELADRLSTAMELLTTPQRAEGLGCLQIADAVERAQAIVAREAAPIVAPREIWVALAACAAIALWVHYLEGWSLPGLPAARTAAAIHAEGGALVAIGRQLDILARARGLPEARRIAPHLSNLGRRLEEPRVSRRMALGLLRDAARQIRDAQARVDGRLSGAGPATRGTGSAQIGPTTPANPSRLHQAVRQLEAISGQLRSDSASQSREDLAQRLRDLSQSLEQMEAPASSQRYVAAARRDVEQGRLGAASPALGDALQDLQSLERMLGDEQALGQARRQVQQSSDRIAQAGSTASNPRIADQPTAEPGPPRAAPGSNPITATSDDATPPPPGPNQGSLPGQGRGPTLGTPTPRLGGSRVEEHLAGRQGEGTSTTRDLFAPGRGGTPQLPAQPPPLHVALQNDHTLARDPVPPAYQTIVRRYFETLGARPGNGP
jgi:hypothetical protein